MSPLPDDAATSPTAAAPAELAAPTEARVVAPAGPAAAPAAEATAPGTAAGSPAPAAGAPAADLGPPPPTNATPATEPAAPSKPAVEPLHLPGEDHPREPLPRHVLLYTVFALLCTGIGLWLVFAWNGYKEKYSQTNEGWRLGTTKMIEITLIKEDKKNLACASDRSFGGVHCAHARDGKFLGVNPEDSPNILQPFNTVKNELFLAAGVWQAPVLKEPLPADRFTVVCNYHVIGVLKAVALRWSPTGSFGPVDQSVAAGTLSDCVIPE